MKIGKLSFIILLGLLAFISNCGDSGKPYSEITNTFPLTAGSRWEYDHYRYNISFNDSVPPDTFYTHMSRRVIGIEPSIDTLQLTIVEDTWIGNELGFIDTLISRSWYGFDNSKLKIYGSRNFRPNETGGPIIFSRPLIMLDLPLDLDKEWAVIEGIDGTGYKKVINREELKLAGREFNCDIVGMAGEMDYPDFSMNREWYSNEGLIMRRYDWGTQMIEDEQGIIIDSMRVYETTELTAIHIEP